MEGKFIIHVLNYVAYEDRTETKILDVDGKNVFTFDTHDRLIAVYYIDIISDKFAPQPYMS